MIFLDTNVVVAYLVSSHSFHAKACSIVEDVFAKDEDAVISPQIVAEAFRVMVPGENFRIRLDARRFQIVIGEFLSDPGVTLISPGETAIRYALESAAEKNISSSRIFDLLIYGTMREHGVTRIATFNEKDFAGLEGIELVPLP